MGSYEKNVKQLFHDAHKKSMKEGNLNTGYSFEMILVLARMAREDIYPDDRFGDDDCSIWSMFRRC